MVVDPGRKGRDAFLGALKETVGHPAQGAHFEDVPAEGEDVFDGSKVATIGVLRDYYVTSRVESDSE